MSKPHLVLKALGRRAKHNRSPIFANVTGFWGRPSAFGGGDEYSHPRIEFSTEERGSDDVDVVFQQHALRGDDIVKSRPQPSGFMQHEGRWSHCYGGRLEARSCEYKGSRRWIRRVLDLLDRASEVQVKSTGDDLLTLIVQLRKIGVEVRIFNNAVEARRNAHPRRRTEPTHYEALYARHHEAVS